MKQSNYVKPAVCETTDLRCKCKYFLLTIIALANFLTPPDAAAQSAIRLTFTNQPLAAVLNAIAGSSEYTFFFSDDVDTSFPVSVDLTDDDIDRVMSAVLDGTPIDYEIADKRIVLTHRDDESGTPRTFRGTVLDEQGKPIAGATVMVKGTTEGTTTDAEGRFELKSRKKSLPVEVAFLGYQNQEVVLRNSSTEIRLVDVSQLMEDVVVVGYGTQKRGDVTGAIASVSSKELTVAPVANTSNALAGRLPGLIVKQQSGLPGADGATLSIRGFDAPLVIVDGVESSFTNIDANEIESISVLKDASAAIYGARAGNGVVLVTTKRGKTGKPTITLNSTFTLQNPMQLMKMASAGQYTEMVREAHLQSGQPESTCRFTEEQIAKYYAGNDPDYPSTDWFDYLIRDLTPQHQHNLSLRGGSEKIKYYGFFGYLDQESMIKRGGGNYERYNIRSNIDAKILDNLTMTVDFSTIIEQRRYPWRDSEGANSIWQDIWNTEPIYPASLPDSDKIPYANGGGTGGAHISSNRDLSGTRDTDNTAIRAQASLQWDIRQVPGLAFKANVTLDKWYQDYKFFQYLPDTYTYNHASDTYTKMAKGIDTKLDQRADNGRTLTSQISASYDRQFGEHSVSAMALFETIDQRSTWISAGRSDFDSKLIPYLFAGGLLNQTANGAAAEMGRASLIGRLRYNYAQKYLFEATVRYDGSAKFAKGSRWGLFPSVSIGWRLSEESFIKDNAPVISNLKIRGGISQSGNDNVANFNYLAGYIYGNIYDIGSSSDKGLVATGLANPTLSWETMTNYNVGLDFGFFQNKLYGEADFFYRDRDGIPGNRATSIPDIFGENLPVENLNRISTRGFEFQAGYKNNAGDFHYDVSANVSWSRSRWEHYDEPEYTDPDDIRINKKTGKWIDEVYGYRSAGLFTSQEQIDRLDYNYMAGSDNSFLKQGDVVLLNTNGDDTLDWRDQQVIGKGNMPHWMTGLNVNLGWRGIDFSMLWQGAFGFSHQVVLERGIAKPEVMFQERWTYENNNPHAIVPRLGGAASNSWGSDYNIVDGDYLRLKQLSIGYTFPARWMQKIKIGSLRIYLAGTNLVTFSKLNKYKIDPEAASGQGGYYYPQMRTFTLGINLTL